MRLTHPKGIQLNMTIKVIHFLTLSGQAAGFILSATTENLQVKIFYVTEMSEDEKQRLSFLCQVSTFLFHFLEKEG